MAIMGLPSFDPNTPWTFVQWEDATQKQHNKWKVQQQYRKGTMDAKRQVLHQVFRLSRRKGGGHQCHPNHIPVSQGGNVMDIDAINSLSKAERTELMKLNTC